MPPQHDTFNHRGVRPNQDLGSLGVPFLSVDEDGRSVLNKPLLTETKEDDKPAGVDQPPKPNEDFPDCTTYFYHRWMWIQVNIVSVQTDRTHIQSTTNKYENIDRLCTTALVPYGFCLCARGLVSCAGAWASELPLHNACPLIMQTPARARETHVCSVNVRLVEAQALAVHVPPY